MLLRTAALLCNNVTRVALRNTVRRDVTRCLTTRCFHSISPHRYQIYSTKRAIATPWGEQFRFYANYPDHKKVTLSALSRTMKTGTIISWQKKEGDKLNEGDLLAEIGTDQTTTGLKTSVKGYLAKIVVPAGPNNIDVGSLLCIIVPDADSVAAFKDFKDDEASVAAPPPPVLLVREAALAPLPTSGIVAGTLVGELATELPSRLQVSDSPQLDVCATTFWEVRDKPQFIDQTEYIKVVI